MRLDDYPYPSRRRAVLAAGGVVATSQPLAAEAGAFVMRSGGNAVDAAIATAAALTVVEPTSNGLGGDAFALIWHRGALSGLNGSGVWPRRADPERLRARGHAAVPERGWAPVTVPGAPAVWRDLHARFGRLELSRVLAPAIDYAERGFPVSPVVARYWQQAVAGFAGAVDPALAGFADTFARSGAAPGAGEMAVLPGHARSLRRFAERGISEFYQGEIAEALSRLSERTGGWLRADDLASHESEWVEPLSVRYRDHEVWQLPPNCPGLIALEALGILDGFDLPGLPHASAEAWHLQLEAIKLALSDVQPRLCDPKRARIDLRRCLTPEHLAQRRLQIGDRAGDPTPAHLPRGGTVYLGCADAEGTMVSFIQSNYMGFGSGVVEPEYGIALQNRGACFSLDREHDDEAAPGLRPRHTLMPGFLTRGGAPVGPFGVMGGEMQPQGHVQVASSLIDHGLNPQAALDAPRFRSLGGRRVLVEAATPEPVVEALRARGHEVGRSEDRGPFGRGQIICRLASGAYAAGTEPRADGGVAAF